MSEENIQSIIPPDGTPTISKSEDFVGDPEITELKGIQEKYVQQESETDNLIKLRDEYILHLVELQKKREQAEIEKGNPIQNLIDNAENLRLTQEKQIEQLRETEEEFNILSKRVEAINKLVAQNPIAPEVQKAIENHNQSLESLRSDHERLTNEIQSIELDLIPEELIDEYKENMETEKKLDYQVALIEDNPNVIKRLVEYAENEDKMRTIIIDSIANNCSNKLQRDIMSTAMQMFLTEQFELAGFNQIEEDKKRHEAMQNFTREVLSGINWDKSNGYPTKNEKIGLLLKNLTGQLGNFDDTIDFLREASGIESLIDNSSEQEQVSTAAVKQFIHAHIGTINYLRSVYKGAKNYRGKIFGEKSPNEIWERFDSRIKLYGFDIAENGGVIPKENLNDKEEIVIDYNEKLKKATELNEKLTSQEINDLKKQVEKISSYIDDGGYEEDLKEAQGMDEARWYLRGKGIRNQNEYREKSLEFDQSKNNKNRELRNLQSTLHSLSPISFKHRREIREQIAQTEKELENIWQDYLKINREWSSAALDSTNRKTEMQVRDYADEIKKNRYEMSARLNELTK